MTTNYARHIGSEHLRFFTRFTEETFDDLAEWAFFALPVKEPSRFKGHLIGESSDMRCVRMKHAPRDKRCSCTAAPDGRARQ